MQRLEQERIEALEAASANLAMIASIDYDNVGHNAQLRLRFRRANWDQRILPNVWHVARIDRTTGEIVGGTHVDSVRVNDLIKHDPDHCAITYKG